MLDYRDMAITDIGNTDLDPNSDLCSTTRRLNSGSVLLPFEEHLNLLTVFIKFGNFK